MGRTYLVCHIGQFHEVRRQDLVVVRLGGQSLSRAICCTLVHVAPAVVCVAAFRAGPGLPAHPARRGRRDTPGSGPAEGRCACAVRSSLEAGGAAPYHARRT